MLFCKTCKLNLPTSSYYVAITNNRGFALECKDCYNSKYRVKRYNAMSSKRKIRRFAIIEEKRKARLAVEIEKYARKCRIASKVKTCTVCKIEKNKSFFSKSCKSYDDLKPRCKECSSLSDKEYYIENPEQYKDRNRLRAAYFGFLRPLWADNKTISAFYKSAKTLRMDVDHIIPLGADNVSGLHCEANLQMLSRADNTTKGNRFWPDMW